MHALLKNWTRLALAALAAAAQAADLRYPEDAGVVDVTKAPYFAKGDGRTDDTEAIQQALLDHPNSNRIIFLPDGEYLVSNSIHWPGGADDTAQSQTIVEGASRSGSIVRLMDYAPAFANTGRPRAVLWMGDHGAHHDRNAVRNLTLRTGVGNPGAIGLQFLGNHQACVRDVTILSGDGGGIAGLDLSTGERQGPCLIKNVRIEGFEFGIRLAGPLYLAVIESLELEAQRVAGLRNAGLVVCLRDLRSINAVSAIQNTDPTGIMTLLDSTLKGLPSTRRSPSAVVNRGMLFARKVGTPGYTNAIENRAGHNEGAAGPEVTEFVSHTLLKQFPAPQYALGLPVEATPEPAADPSTSWAAPKAGPIGPTGDDGPALQAAVDSGAGTVYLPNGAWTIRSTVVLRGKAKRLTGCEARLTLRLPEGKPAFRLESGEAPAVLLERLSVDSTSNPLVEQASSRDLAIKDVLGANLLWTGQGGVFLEDVSSTAPCTVPKGRRLWARQWNISKAGTKLTNDGGTAWLLGFCGELPGTSILTRAGGERRCSGAW